MSQCLVNIIIIVIPPPVGKGTISVAFVRPSICPSVCPPVRLSVAYITNNSRTQSVPKFEGKLLTFDATRIPVSRLKGQSSKLSGPLMLTHIVRHIFRTARPTNFKLGIRMEDDDPHQSLATWPQRLKVKVAMYVISLSRLAPMLYLCH